MQDVFVRALEHHSTFRGESATVTWLHRITVNACISNHRRLRVRSRADQLMPRKTAVRPIAMDRMVVRTALATLPPIDRRIFILYEVIGYTHREIAAILRIPEGTSKWKLTAVRRQLRGHIGSGRNNAYCQRFKEFQTIDTATPALEEAGISF